MKRAVLLGLVVILVTACKTSKKSNNRSRLASDDLRLSFDPRRPQVGEEFTVQVEILRDEQLVTTGPKVTVQLSHRCGRDKNYSRVQLADSKGGIAEIKLTIGKKRGQAMTCDFRAIANGVTREKRFVELDGDDRDRHDDRDRYHRDDHRRSGKVTISKPVITNDRGSVAFAKEFTVTSPYEIDIELVECGNAKLFHYQTDYRHGSSLTEADRHTLPVGKSKMFIIGKVDRDCDFEIDGARDRFDSFSSTIPNNFERPDCPESLDDHHDIAFHEDDDNWHKVMRTSHRRWDRDDLLVKIDGWWCLLED